MKFLTGFILGIIGTLGALYILEQSSQEDFILFQEKGQCVTQEDLEVFQVLDLERALVRQVKFLDFTVMLLVNDSGKTYYDDEVIKIPAKKCARQIGTFRYHTKDKNYKTVPVVRIEDI